MSIDLGLGLIGIGREWGYRKTPIPHGSDVILLLERAFNLGIRFFDTAPSYGTSEQRLGEFLQTLNLEQRKEIRVATKFGEHWDFQTQSTYVEHSFEALKASIDKSLSYLGQIDILQLHKTTPEVLKSHDLQHALEYAKQCGVHSFGASISDMASGELACYSNIFSFIQLPANKSNKTFDPIIALAKLQDKLVIVNRPFNTGAMLYSTDDVVPVQEGLKIEAFKYLLEKGFHGIILTGTKSIEHLEENVKAFNKASNLMAL